MFVLVSVPVFIDTAGPFDYREGKGGMAWQLRGNKYITKGTQVDSCQTEEGVTERQS